MGVTKEKSEGMYILVVALWVRSTNACQRDTVDVNSRLRNFFLVQQTTRGCWNDEKWSNVLSRLQIKTAMGRLEKLLLYKLSHFLQHSHAYFVISKIEKELVILDLAIGKVPEFFTQGKVKKNLSQGRNKIKEPNFFALGKRTKFLALGQEFRFFYFVKVQFHKKI